MYLIRARAVISSKIFYNTRRRELARIKRETFGGKKNKTVAGRVLLSPTARAWRVPAMQYTRSRRRMRDGDGRCERRLRDTARRCTVAVGRADGRVRPRRRESPRWWETRGGECPRGRWNPRRTRAPDTAVVARVFRNRSPSAATARSSATRPPPTRAVTVGFRARKPALAPSACVFENRVRIITIIRRHRATRPMIIPTR